MEMFKDPAKVHEKLCELGLDSWAALYNLSQNDRITVFGPYEIPLKHYSAACHYKNVMHWDWGHEPYTSATPEKPVCTNIIVGKNTNDATMSINQLAASLQERTTSKELLSKLECLGHALLKHAHRATDDGGIREIELV